MNLVFHWFLPTSGDGRGIVGGGALNGWRKVTETPAVPGLRPSITWRRSPGRPSNSGSPGS